MQRALLLACLAAVLARAGAADSAAHQPGTTHRHMREEPEHHGGGIKYELVIARHSEDDLSWFARAPRFWEVTIYNKGGEEHPMPEPPEGRHWTVIDLENVGREANTFAEHLVRRYGTLADYTVFSQADPFVHNRHYLELLRNPTLLGSVQGMSRVYKRDGDERFRTPEEAVAIMSRHPWYRSERVSTRTLNSVWYHDEGSVNIQRGYRAEQGNLPPGINLIRHYFSRIGLPNWIPNELEGTFAFGGLLGFERSRALQHPKQVYEKMLETTQTAGWATPYVIERSWLMLFGGAHFHDI